MKKKKKKQLAREEKPKQHDHLENCFFFNLLFGIPLFITNEDQVDTAYDFTALQYTK